MPSGRPDKSLLWFGKYLSLALTLPASVFGGYILGAFAGRHLHLTWVPIVGIVLGFAGGFVQILRELSRDEKRDKFK
jgi:hypothetical protein